MKRQAIICIVMGLLALTTTMPAPAQCIDDGYEENDTFDDAAVVEPLQMADVHYCPGDDDYFTFFVPAGSDIAAEISFRGYIGDLDLFLYDPDRNLIAWSMTAEDMEQLEVSQVTEAGWYFLRVSGSCGELVYYRLSWGYGCIDDGLEPNNSFADAVHRPANPSPGTHWHGLQVCPDDDDWYFTWLHDNFEELDVKIRFTHADGDLDLYLYDENQNLLGYSTSITDDEQVVIAYPPVGNFYILVTGYDGAANEYVLSVDFGCYDDSLEENDSFAEARWISPGEYTPQMICSGDDDYYIFSAEAGEEIEVKLRFTHYEGDLDVYLYDSGYSDIAYSAGVDDYEDLWLSSAPYTGDYYLRVIGYDGAENHYLMRLEVGCHRDAYEFNDSLETPAPVGEGLTTGLAICLEDEDNFTFFAEAGEDLELDILFSHADADLAFIFRDPGLLNNILANTGTDNESLSYFDLPYTGWYNVHVFNYGYGGSASYDLSIELTCHEDGGEENDTAAEAALVFPGEYPQLRVCPNDDDWFVFFADQGEPLQAEILFTHYRGDLDIGLYSDTLELLDYSNSVTDNEIVTLPAAPYTGYYLLEVYGYEGAGNLYDMVIDNGCADDAFEENDDAPTATPLAPGYHAPLRICSGDPDVFSFDAVAGDPLQLTLVFSHAAGDLNLYLFDPAWELIAWSDSTTDHELISLPAAPSTGTYLALVMGALADQTVYGLGLALGNTITVDLPCNPASGTLPYPLTLQPAMQNNDWFTRTLRGRIDVTIASGTTFNNWRSGFTNVAAHGQYSTSFNVNLPALPTLRGDNVFRLVGTDITASPYNQPPYSPSGHTDSDSCTTTGH